MSFYLMLTTAFSGAIGACTRFGCQRIGLSVWQINALASVLIGATLAVFATNLTLVALLGFLAGFSTVSGQVAEVFKKQEIAKLQLLVLFFYVVVGGLLAGTSFTLLQVLVK